MDYINSVGHIKHTTKLCFEDRKGNVKGKTETAIFKVKKVKLNNIQFLQDSEATFQPV